MNNDNETRGQILQVYKSQQEANKRHKETQEDRERADEDRERAEAEDAALWAHFQDWVWDDALLRQLP